MQWETKPRTILSCNLSQLSRGSRHLEAAVNRLFVSRSRNLIVSAISGFGVAALLDACSAPAEPPPPANNRSV